MRKPVVVGLIVGVVVLAFSTLLLARRGGMMRREGMPHGEMKQGKMPHGPMGRGEMSQAERPEQGDLEEGKALYERLCVTCHGASGKGDGPTGKLLTPRPSSFAAHVPHHGAQWDDYYFDIIKDGGRAVGRSPVMPAWGSQLESKKIWDVVSYIWTLVQGAGEPADKGDMLRMQSPGGGK